MMAAGAAMLVLLAACGGGARQAAAPKGTIEIAVDAPLNGVDKTQGQALRDGVELAVSEQPVVAGYRIAVRPFDDAVQGRHDPAQGAANLQQMVNDAQILGMVGPLNSNVAEAEIPEAAAAHLAMVSPANTDTCLTRDDGSCSGKASGLRNGNPNPYARLTTLDAYQAPAAARYLSRQLHRTKVAVGGDSDPYDTAIADDFANQFVSMGGKVVAGTQDKDSQAGQGWAGLLSEAEKAGADAIFWNGGDNQASCPAPPKVKGGIAVVSPSPGGAQILSGSGCAAMVKSQSLSVASTLPAVDPDHVTGARSLIRTFDNRFGQQRRTSYAIIAHDATGTLLAAIGQAVGDAKGKVPSREQVRRRLTATSGYQGVLGTVSFDPQGDNRTRIVSIYQHPAPGRTVWATQYNLAKG
jgi:branched-chain amino acid transport system substrate-binding protein